ncbi:hypothetical protein SAMN05216403_1299 [Nitrosospira multiformis ATCC 25196]|uniref:Uncharacterized protein n=1 Tax=Nitrosospira multiformis (strain ATCC 25196 / NCIMB 11849 / C 71) TaxID=323848 RepID=A0A1H5XCC4_NITMU|nr:hypothetical protein SAMN05216411_12025 [Nitrosospira multiformis]SEG09408.1 hypothetical protein SAMN05216403_1299 [Nitrosospira multiformis ATCC 25196]
MFECACICEPKRATSRAWDKAISNLASDPRETYGSLAPYVHEEELAVFLNS